MTFSVAVTTAGGPGWSLEISESLVTWGLRVSPSATVRYVYRDQHAAGKLSTWGCGPIPAVEASYLLARYRSPNLKFLIRPGPGRIESESPGPYYSGTGGRGRLPTLSLNHTAGQNTAPLNVTVTVIMSESFRRRPTRHGFK